MATENQDGVKGSGVSPFAQQISQLPDPLVNDTTTAPLTNDTTVAPLASDTTTAPLTNDTTQADDNQEQTVVDYLRTTEGITDPFENSVEGLVQLVNKVKETASDIKLKEKFTQRPILAQLDKHLEDGKSIESFFQVQQINANKIEVPKLTGDDKLDAQNKVYYKDVIVANLRASGLNDKQVARIIDSSELENSLYEDAVEAADSWNKRQDARAAQVTQQEEEYIRKQVEDTKKTIEDITNIVTKGTINNSVIPANERQSFLDFLIKTDDKGMAERDRKLADLPLDKYLLFDYLLFKNFDVKGLQPVAPKVQPITTLNKMTGGGGSSGNEADKNVLPPSLAGMDFRQLRKQ